jgi:hypothetical protein
MSVSQQICRHLPPSLLPFFAVIRTFGTSAAHSKYLRDNNASTAIKNQSCQKSRPLNPYLADGASARTSDFSKVNQKSSPLELLSPVDLNYRPVDPFPGKVKHLAGGMQKPETQKPELGVGEIEGITFKIEPLRRGDEDLSTMRARLLC